MIFNIGETYFYYKADCGIINDYYQNIVKLIKQIIINNPNMKINITLCERSYYFDNTNTTLNIDINYEHTLVIKGGRDVSIGTPFGNIDYNNNEKYLVRIDNYNTLIQSDIIIDYSNPNIYNVKSCPIYDIFSRKHIYISPSIYEPYILKENREIMTLTTFINANEPRRMELLQKIHPEHVNVNTCFHQDALQQLLQNTKILINIHQTPHHHTFEELRVLPALECGVIVISEISPLMEKIPYKDLIIWANYEDIIDKIKEVIDNYDFFHNNLFSTDNMKVLFNLPQINYDILQKRIKNFIDNE